MCQDVWNKIWQWLVNDNKSLEWYTERQKSCTTILIDFSFLKLMVFETIDLSMHRQAISNRVYASDR